MWWDREQTDAQTDGRTNEQKKNVMKPHNKDRRAGRNLDEA